jgi:GNAT superfamily N-acetyltransferase
MHLIYDAQHLIVRADARYETGRGLLPFCLFAPREEEAVDPVHGHITSLAVARTHRKMGIAAKLMTATRKSSLPAAVPPPTPGRQHELHQQPGYQ